MKNTKVVSLVSLMLLSVQAHASLLVEQYNDYWSQSLSSLVDYANNNDASASGYYDIIDFTDDPAGFAGEIPGSNAWLTDDTDTFFAKIFGEFETTFNDTFWFRTFNDDGVFVIVDGELIINDPTLHPEQKFTASKYLETGIHTVELYFFENSGEASLEFSVANSSQEYGHFFGEDSPFQVPVTQNVPEPATLGALLLGLVTMVGRKRKAV